MTGNPLEETQPNSNQIQEGETLPLPAVTADSDPTLVETQPVDNRSVENRSAENRSAMNEPEQNQAAAPFDPDMTIPSQAVRAETPDSQEVIDAETRRQAAISTGSQPHQVEPESSSPPPPTADGPIQTPTKKRGRGFGWLFAGGILLLILVAAGSIYSGYQSGISDRQFSELTQVASSLDEQFELAMQDLEGERYSIARQRLEYILQINPAYPGLIDAITVAELAMNVTATPTVMPTPTLTPTPDTRGVDTLYEQAQQAMSAQDWSAAIDALLALRKADPAYESIKVDGMLYMALRNRGVDKILRSTDLEGGTYDLALAERFGPLDTEARNYRIWVNLYVTGASFWQIDWGRAVEYFSQLALMAPGLRDASGWTAGQRYTIALTEYANAVAAEEDWCQAQELYETALAAGGDPSLQQLAEEAAQRCNRDGGEGEGEQAPAAENPPPPEETPTGEPSPEPQISPLPSP